MGIARRRIGADAMAVLQSHDWPGNIRQLRNNVERLMILAAGDPEAGDHRRDARPKVGALVARIPTGLGARADEACRSARRAKCFERGISYCRRSAGSAAIFRAPPNSFGMERSALHRN